MRRMFITSMVLIAICEGYLAVAALSAPNRLLDGRGGFLLATPGVAADTDSMLTILRIAGNPATTGRMLSFNAYVSDDHTMMTLRAFATDGGTPRIILTEIFGNNVVLASCPTPSERVVGECNYDWPVTAMIGGNNELRMEYQREGIGTAPGLKFQTYGRIGKP